jgi:hypothetical protein
VNTDSFNQNPDNTIDQLWRVRIGEATREYKPQIHAVMPQRYGLDATQMTSMSEVGQLVNLSRESIRGVEKSVIAYCSFLVGRLEPRELAFISTISSLLPASEEEIQADLIRTGWLGEKWALEGIQKVYGWSGHPVPWRLRAGQGSRIWFQGTPDLTLPSTPEISTLVHRSLAGYNAMPIKQAIRLVEGMATQVWPTGTALALLRATPRLVVTSRYLIRVPDTTARSRFHNGSEVTLRACGPLPMHVLYQGLRRHYAARGTAPISFRLACELWRHHPSYKIAGDTIWLSRSSRPKRPTRVESLTLGLLSKEGSLTRSDLKQRLTQKRVPVSTIATMLSFSPLLEPVPGTRGCWRRRGSNVLPALGSSNPKTPTRVPARVNKRPNGRLRLVFPITKSDSGLIYLPIAESHTLRGEQFRVQRLNGREISAQGKIIKVDSQGRCWGWPTPASIKSQWRSTPLYYKVDFDLEMKLAEVRLGRLAS